MDSSLALMKTTKDFDRKIGGVSLANLQVSKNPILLRTKVLKYLVNCTRRVKDSVL